MATLLKNRTEILFLYESENANPNGDPLNENRPRYDSEDNTVLVSDVRLKRTIRDYLFAYKGFDGTAGKDIFVRETQYEDKGQEYVADGKRRAKAFKEDLQTVLDQCIDVRTFGGVMPLDKSSITLVGPTQFQMGKSLNKTQIITEQGTGAFASSDGKKQSTFRTEFKVPYVLIGFNGIINEKAAAYSQMTEEDKALLLEAIWEGTKNLISRSKFGQAPLLLLTVEYKEAYYIGGLRQRLKLISEKNEMQLRSTSDYTLDVSDLIGELTAQKDKISSVMVRIDSRLQTSQPLTNGLLTL